MNDERNRTTSGFLNWILVKKLVYPVLAPLVMEHSKQLQELVSTDFLDMKVIYIIRLRMDRDKAGYIRISRKLFESYGISRETLHRQALKNLNQDGYRLRDMDSIFEEFLGWTPKKETARDFSGETEIKEGKLYVLTNKYKLYGAAGILNKKFLRKKSRGKSFFILPSSVHETIFVPFEEGADQAELDKMVSEINRTQVIPEERLTNHSYFYDAQADEIRISA